MKTEGKTTASNSHAKIEKQKHDKTRQGDSCLSMSHNPDYPRESPACDDELSNCSLKEELQSSKRQKALLHKNDLIVLKHKKLIRQAKSISNPPPQTHMVDDWWGYHLAGSTETAIENIFFVRIYTYREGWFPALLKDVFCTGIEELFNFLRNTIITRADRWQECADQMLLALTYPTGWRAPFMRMSEPDLTSLCNFEKWLLIGVIDAEDCEQLVKKAKEERLRLEEMKRQEWMEYYAQNSKRVY